jgi:NAD+ synthase
MAESERGRMADDFEGRQREGLEIYQRRNRANRHKMEPIPTCVLPKELKS